MKQDPIKMEIEKIRILIADDHEVVRRGLILVLRQIPDFEIIGEANNGEDAYQMALVSKPHIVLLDWKMPEKDGLTVARLIHRNCSDIKTIVLTGAPLEDEVFDALEEVNGFVHKDISPTNLAHAIRVVAQGERYLGPTVTQALLQRSRQQHEIKTRPALSPRELEVLKLMATPATYYEIANQLIISETTVRTHVKRILIKLNQPNRTQAIISAIRLNLITLE